MIGRDSALEEPSLITNGHGTHSDRNRSSDEIAGSNKGIFEIKIAKSAQNLPKFDILPI